MEDNNVRDPAPVTIDFTEGYKLPGDVLAQGGNEYGMLERLWEGMEFLYAQVKRVDELVTQRPNPSGKGIVQFYGSSLRWTEGIPLGLIAAAFDWYFVSSTNY